MEVKISNLGKAIYDRGKYESEQGPSVFNGSKFANLNHSISLWSCKKDGDRHVGWDYNSFGTLFIWFSTTLLCQLMRFTVSSSLVSRQSACICSLASQTNFCVHRACLASQQGILHVSTVLESDNSALDEAGEHMSVNQIWAKHLGGQSENRKRCGRYVCVVTTLFVVMLACIPMGM